MRNTTLILLFLVVLRVILHSSPYKDGDKVRVTGKVSREVIVFERSQLIEVEGLRTYLDKFPEVNYGDRVVVVGTVNDGQIDDPVLEKVEQTNNILYSFRRRLISFYKNSLPEPHSSLVAGIAMGSKSGMPASFWEALRLSGTAHVVVASGMNVTLVGGFLLASLVKVVDRRKAIVGVLAGVWIYAILAGFDAPIVRAAIMGSIAFSAQALGRLNQAINALLISAALMILINPLWLRDIGFQLSFMATASLILFESKVERLIYFVPAIIRQDFSTSLAAQIGVAPLLVYYFQSFNILSPFVNAVVLWTIPIITIVGMLAGVAGLLVPILGRILLMLIFPLTTWFVSIVNLVS